MIFISLFTSDRIFASMLSLCPVYAKSRNTRSNRSCLSISSSSVSTFISSCMRASFSLIVFVRASRVSFIRSRLSSSGCGYKAFFNSERILSSVRASITRKNESLLRLAHIDLPALRSLPFLRLVWRHWCMSQRRSNDNARCRNVK